MNGSASDQLGDAVARWMNPDSAAFDTGQFGQAARFKNADQAIALTGSFIQTHRGYQSEKPFSVSLWFQEPAARTPSRALIGQGFQDGWELRLHSSREVRADAYIDFISRLKATLKPNTFTNFIFIVDPTANRTRLFVNGIENRPDTRRGFDSIRPKVRTIGEPLVIGNQQRQFLKSNFHGLIDDVAIWDRALTAREVLAISDSAQSLGETFDLTKDTDGDQLTDAQEKLTGLDPLDPTDAPQLHFQRTQDAVSLEWNSLTGRSYHVQYRAELGTSPWQTITAFPIIATESIARYQDRSLERLAEGNGYYRVHLLPLPYTLSRHRFP